MDRAIVHSAPLRSRCTIEKWAWPLSAWPAALARDLGTSLFPKEHKQKLGLLRNGNREIERISFSSIEI